MTHRALRRIQMANLNKLDTVRKQEADAFAKAAEITAKAGGNPAMKAAVERAWRIALAVEERREMLEGAEEQEAGAAFLQMHDN